MFKLKVSEFLDKLLLLIAMLAFLWVGISALQEAKFLDSISGSDRPLLSEMKVNAPRYQIEYDEERKSTWKDPESQNRGEDWMFDLFTPPVIYYDPSNQEFAVTPPNLQPQIQDDGTWSLNDIELVEVRLRPYRLQLVGYAGEPGNYVVSFEHGPSGNLVLLREGVVNQAVGVKLIGFRERQVEVVNTDSMPVLQNVGVAQVLDLKTNTEISLTNMEVKMFSDLEARLRVLRDGRVLLLKKGGQVELEDSKYVIGDLSTDPEEAIITKISIDGTRRRTLTLTPNTRLQTDSERATLPDNDNPFSIRSTRNNRPLR